MDLKNYIRTIPNFPAQGVMFRDVTTLFNNAAAFREMIDQFYLMVKSKNITKIAGIDARGFILGSALCYKMSLPFVPVRKKGKLPADVVSQDYKLEYGSATLEIHKDAVDETDNVLIIDDLIATGGTALAAISLIKKLNAKIAGCVFLVELPELGGVEKIREMNIPSSSLVSFEGH